MTSRRTALVTGAAQGLGAAIARALHEDGLNVVLTDVADAEPAARALDPRGETAWARRHDVRSMDDWHATFDAIVTRHGRLDVLVNNAGVLYVREFTEIGEAEWDDVLAVNLRSVFFGCQLAGPHMAANGWGRIVNLASIAGQIGSRLAGAHYSASKGGVLTLTKVAAKEWAAQGVTVNALAPAVVRVPLMDELPQDRLGALIETIPVGRIGEAEEVGRLVAYLASDAAGYITGATFDINGGGFMR